MSIFIGDFQGKADAKGRIVLPIAFKHVLDSMNENRIIVKRDIYEKCLLIYPACEWEFVMEDLRSKINPYDKEHMQFMREFQRNTAELQLDANGRILIPKRLMSVINAEKDVTMIGIDKHIELWDSKIFDNQAIDSDTLGSLAQNILGAQSKNK